MLGFGALGEFALGEGPTQTAPKGTFTQFSTSARKKGLAVAVIATTFVGFVPPPQAQAAVFTKFSEPAKKKAIAAAPWNFSIPRPATQTAIFTQFSQPRQAKPVVVGEQPQGLFETLPAPTPFTGFARFSEPLRAKLNISLHIGRWWQPITLPVDTHDGVFVKKKRKKHGPDPIDLELEEKAKRRAAIELAVYGPEVVYQTPPAAIAEAIPPAPPPNVEDLARAIVQARSAEMEAQRQALEQDDEDVIEMILRDL